MSDDKRPPREDTIPPEIRPYMGLDPLPPIIYVEDPELEASFDRVEAALAVAAAEEARLDAQRGVGNVREYVAKVTVPTRAAAAAVKVEDKVSIAEGPPDVLRALPAGDRRAQTEESDTRALLRGGPRQPNGESDEATVLKAPAVASPWVKLAPQDEVRGSALPSSLRPRELHEGEAPPSARPSDEKPAGVPEPGSGRWKMTALGAAILIVAVMVGARALTTGRPPESVSHGPAAPVATVATTTPSVSVATSTVGEQAPPLTSAAISVESPPVPVPSSVPAAPQIAPRPRPRGVMDDPYSDPSAPSPAVTVQPDATVPTTQPTVVPAPTPAKTNSPAAGSIPEF